MADRFRSFDELAAEQRDGVDYQIRVHRRESATAILAPYGGRIEPGTSEIAEYIAATNFSFYAFEGIRSGHNERLRLEPADFDEPQCLELAGASRLSVLVRGCGSGGGVRVSGGHAVLRKRVADMLAVARFTASEDEADNASPAALCNRAAPGICIAISKELRNEFIAHPRHMDQFVAVVRSVLLQHELEQQQQRGFHRTAKKGGAG